jgi:hypothetical protein
MFPKPRGRPLLVLSEVEGWLGGDNRKKGIQGFNQQRSQAFMGLLKNQFARMGSMVIYDYHS